MSREARAASWTSTKFGVAAAVLAGIILLLLSLLGMPAPSARADRMPSGADTGRQHGSGMPILGSPPSAMPSLGESAAPAQALGLSSRGRIAFVWVRKRSHIWSGAADGSGLRQLTRGNRNEHAPAWSPDRSSIAFVRGTAGKVGATSLWLMKSNGTDVRRVHYTGPSVSDAAGDLAWSPSGRYIAGAALASAYQCAVTVLDLQTHTSQVVYTASIGYWLLGSVDWSPDSRYVVACVRTGDPGPTVIVDMTGATATREVDFGSNSGAYSVSWRPDGGCLQFFVWGIRDPATENELWTFDGTLLGTLRPTLYFSYSPNSAEYCYVTQLHQHVVLRRAHADGRSPKTILSAGKWSTRNGLEDVAWK